jgi:hypothetical protein
MRLMSRNREVEPTTKIISIILPVVSRHNLLNEGIVEGFVPKSYGIFLIEGFTKGIVQKVT